MNIEDVSSPQPTPEAPFDSDATNTSIAHNTKKVNVYFGKFLKRESESQYLADLQKIREAYVPDVKENHPKTV